MTDANAFDQVLGEPIRVVEPSQVLEVRRAGKRARRARIDSMAADYDLCVYFQCNGAKFGDDNLSCTDGSEVSGGPNGSHGCCSKNAGTASDFAKVSPSCSFGGLGSESGKVWVNVTPKAAAICGSYTLTWSAKN